MQKDPLFNDSEVVYQATLITTNEFDNPYTIPKIKNYVESYLEIHDFLQRQISENDIIEITPDFFQINLQKDHNRYFVLYFHQGFIYKANSISNLMKKNIAQANVHLNGLLEDLSSLLEKEKLNIYDDDDDEDDKTSQISKSSNLNFTNI